MASNEDEATLLIDDLDTLSYFSPTLTRKATSLPSSSTIISSLLSSAGLPASYPPADLTTLITTIETSSTFDTLRRNGLLLYLLIDVSTSPGVIDAFCNARLIPTFWRTSVEAYHAFDHEQYARAMPYLSKENAEPYTELVLRRLDPRQDAKLARYALQFLKVARPDVVKASKEAQQAVLIAKAIGEGLAAALELARTIDATASAAQALGPWLFAKRRPKLLAEFVRLPLTPQEVQGVRDFALAPSAAYASASTATAQRRAIDGLLLRLLNAGQVVEALRLDREAEEHGLGGDAEEGDEASVAAIKQRREMLRLARQSLPATLRLELEDDDGEDGGYEGGLNGRAGAGMQVDGAGDVSMTAGGSRAPSRTGPTLNTSRTAAATPSSPLVTLPRSASRSLALASQSPLAGSGLASSSSSFTGSPRPQQRGGLPLPRAGYASPSPRTATSALPLTGASARQADTSMQASTSFSSSSNAGPYARLAAQLASSQPQQSANDSGSALLSSLLPQKRAALSSASLASRGGAGGDMAMATGEADVSMDRTMTPPPQPAAGSAFEVPKRRYVPKPSATAAGQEGQQSVGRARGQRQRSQAADGAVAKARAQRGVGASPHKKQRQMMERDEREKEDEEKEPAKDRQPAKARLPRSKSTMPGSFFGDDEEMHEEQGQQDADPEEAEAEPAKPSTRATRTAKGKTTAGGGASSARRGSKDAAAAAATPRRKAAAASTTSRRRRETSTTSSLAPTSPSAHEDEGEDDATYAPPTTRRMTRSQSVMSAVSDAAAGGAGETYDTWTSGTTGDNTARDPLYEQREEEEEEEEEEEGEDSEEGEEDDEAGQQQGGRRRTRTSSSGRKTTKQPPTAGGAKRSTRQRSAQPTSSTPKASPQKRRTGAAATAAAAAGTASATSTPRRSTRRGGA